MRSAEINETFPRRLLEREIPIRSPSPAAAGPTLLPESRQLLLRPLPAHLLRKTCVLKIGRNLIGGPPVAPAVRLRARGRRHARVDRQGGVCCQYAAGGSNGSGRRGTAGFKLV